MEILLSKGKVLSALNFANAYGLETAVSSRKFLQAAKDTGNNEVFLHTYEWLSDRQLLQQRDKAEYANEFKRVIAPRETEVKNETIAPTTSLNSH